MVQRRRVYYESDNTYQIGLYNKARSCGRVEQARLTVPLRIAESLPSDLRFRLTLNEEGILYRPEDGKPLVLPDWAVGANDR